MNTSASPFIPASHRFNGHSNNSPKRGRLFLNKASWPNALVLSQKTQVCILGEIKPQRTGAVRCWSSLLCDKMKETNNISHRAAITGTVKWKWQERARSKVKSLFLLFPYILFETLLTDADVAFLYASSQSKRHLKALFWCFIQTYFVFDLFDKFYIVRANCQNPNNESQKKARKLCVESSRLWIKCGPEIRSGFLMAAAGTTCSNSEIILVHFLHKHITSLMPSKKRRALIKIQHTNNMPNHRLDSDLRLSKRTVHEYLVTLRCHGWLVAWLQRGGLYPSLLN